MGGVAGVLDRGELIGWWGVDGWMDGNDLKPCRYVRCLKCSRFDGCTLQGKSGEKLI